MTDPFDYHEFAGVARLFPLPNLVLFPHVVQPLRIFEPRYKQMTEHALSSDRLIAIVLIQPHPLVPYSSRPAIYDIGCLGRIVHEERQPNGEFHLLMRGLCRLRIESELFDDQLYRSARASPLEDEDADEPPRLRKTLVRAARKWFPGEGPVAEQVEEVLRGDMKLSALCDILAFALPLAFDLKQRLLEELDPIRRTEELVEHLETATPPERLPMPRVKRKFPPDFSVN